MKACSIRRRAMMLLLGLLAGGALEASRARGDVNPLAITGTADQVEVVVQLDVQPKGERDKRPVTPGQILHEGDRISLRVTVDRPAYLYVVQVFPSRGTQVLFPRPGVTEREQRIEANIQTGIPRNGGYVELDQETGAECILAIASSRPLERISPDMIQAWAQAQPEPEPVLGGATANSLSDTSSGAQPPRPPRPPPEPIKTNERGDPLARATGISVLRVRGRGPGPTVARFRFWHQGSPPEQTAQPSAQSPLRRR